MIRKFTALLLCVTMLFPFSLSSASADASFTAERVVFDDLMNTLEENASVSLSSDWRNWCKSLFDNRDYLVCIVIDTDWNFSITTWSAAYSASYWCIQDSSPYGFKYVHTYENSGGNTVYEIQNPSTRNIQFKGATVSRVSSSVTNDVYSGYNWNFSPDFQRSSLPPSTSRYVLASAVNVSNMGNELTLGWKVYYNQDIYTLGDYTSVRYEKNLYKESWDILYRLIVFNVGDSRYLTTKDQYLMRSLNEETDDRRMIIGLGYDENSAEYITYNDLVLIPNGQYFISETLDNLSPLGVYAIDVSSWGDVTVYYSSLYDNPVSVETEIGHAVNVPLPLFSGGESNSNTEAWSTFISYINNYPTDAIVPQQLVDGMFGTDVISQCRVNVLPSFDLYNNFKGGVTPSVTPYPIPENLSYQSYWYVDGSYSSTQYQGIDNMIDFSLLDVVIVDASALYQDTIDLYYRDSSNRSNTILGTYTIEQLFAMHDAIIVVPDAQVGSYALAVYDIERPVGPYYDYDWVARDGISYVSYSSIWDEYTNFYGYMFVNSKAIQKHMLYYFCDGFSKFYKLMSDYIQSEQGWKASFLTFSSALFYKIDSLDGHLNNLDSVISQWAESWGFHASLVEYYLEGFETKIDLILDKLQDLVDNTDEQMHNFWILPVYEFISQFVSSPIGFVNWIDAVEDLNTNAPALPVVTVPLLPSMGVELNE